MKNFPSLELNKEMLSNDNIQLNEQILHGESELVNFPSTAEVFQAVFENSFHASFIGNSRGITIKANEADCKMFGYTNEEMLRLTTIEIFDTTESRYEKYLSQRELNGKAKAEVTGIRKNGERFPCEISSVVFIDDNGEKRTLDTLHDISKKYADLVY